MLLCFIIDHLRSKIKSNMGFIVKNTTFPGLLDLLAPHHCRGCVRLGEPICHRCKNNIILDFHNHCPNCKALNPTGKCPKCNALPPAFVVSERTDLIAHAIDDLKFNSTRALARPLAEILDEILPVIDGQVEIVPLPTIARHVRARGLDHTLAVSKHLARLRGSRYTVNRLIVRAKDTVQIGADRKTRLVQAAEAYKLSPGASIDPDITYLLFDDVWTTGASIKATVKLLKSSGAQKIIVAVLARATLSRR